MQTKKLDHIQVLRALAALMVAAYHYPGGLYVARYAYSGVDLFFVVSGYIMVVTTRDFDGSLPYIVDFWVKRFSRIWPPYVVLTIIAFLYTHYLTDLHSPRVLSWVLESIAMYPQWLTGPILPTGWSLPFEVYFYAIFAVSMFAGRHRWKALAGIFFLTMVAIPLLLRGRFSWLDATAYAFGAQGLGSYLSMITHPIIWNFGAGVLVGIVAMRVPPLSVKWIVLALFCAIAWIIMMLLAVKADHGLQWGIPFSLLMYSLDALCRTRKIWFPPFIVKIGDISYSIYLVQFLLVWAVQSHADRQLESQVWSGLIFFPYVILLIAAAKVSHAILEVRLSQAVKTALQRASRYGLLTVGWRLSATSEQLSRTTDGQQDSVTSS